MPARMSIGLIGGLALFLGGCVMPPAADSPRPTETIVVDNLSHLPGSPSLALSIPAPGWALARVEMSASARPVNIVLPAGRVLRSKMNPNFAFLTLAGAIVPGPSEGVLVPVTAIFGGDGGGGSDSASPTQAARDIHAASFRVDNTLIRAELIEMVGLVSSPERTWRPSRNPLLVVPRDARNLKRPVFASSTAEWSRARDFFSERTPIQIAVWMLLFNFDRADLERELALFGPRFALLDAGSRSASMRKSIADAFALWVALGYDPSDSKLGAEFPDLAVAAKKARRSTTLGDTFPGSASPLTPISPRSAADAPFLTEEALVVPADYQW